MLIGFPMMLADNNSGSNNQPNAICEEVNGSCCLGDVCNLISITCVEGTVPRWEGCDENCVAIATCVNASGTDDNPTLICCHIYGLGAMMKKVNSQYELMEEDGCVVPEDWVGGGREIVSNKRCEEGYTVRIQTALQARNRLRLNQSELPENCTRTGSVIKCNIDGGRVMAVMAGNSGNTIVQVRGVNMTTRAELYHHNGEVYGVFENETRAIEYLPDQLREKIRERTRARLNNTNITLNENGEYEYEAEKESRFLGLFKVREKVKWHINSETGEILRERVPWWGFLANDIEEE